MKTQFEVDQIEAFSSVERVKFAMAAAAYSTSAEAQEEGILPVTVKEINAAEIVIFGVVNKMFAGFVRTKEFFSADDPLEEEDTTFVQIGSLFVPKDFRGLGIAHELIEVATDAVVGIGGIPYAFVNDTSRIIFEDQGYRPTIPGELPSEASSERGNMPVIFTDSGFIGDEQ